METGILILVELVGILGTLLAIAYRRSEGYLFFWEKGEVNKSKARINGKPYLPAEGNK